METPEECVNCNAVSEYIKGSVLKWTELHPVRLLYTKQILTLSASCMSEKKVFLKPFVPLQKSVIIRI